MPAPKYIQELRKKIGHELLIAPGVCGLVFNDAGEILLHKRSDFGTWAVIGGMLEPGETPGDAVVREVLEETGVTCAVENLGIYTTPVITYPNGDQMQYVITCFTCRAVSGTARVNDDESLEVRYFPTNDLPVMREDLKIRIAHAIDAQVGVRFFANGKWQIG